MSIYTVANRSNISHRDKRKSMLSSTSILANQIYYVQFSDSISVAKAKGYYLEMGNGPSIR